MSESIQNATCRTLDGDQVRADFLLRAAVLYDRPPAVDPATLADVDDATAILLSFPWLDDAELLEALWALGEHRRHRRRPDPPHHPQRRPVGPPGRARRPRAAHSAQAIEPPMWETG